MWLSLPIIAVALYYLAEGLFWCFCWCFCTVDNQIQNWNVKKITAKDIQNLKKAFDYKEAV